MFLLIIRRLYENFERDEDGMCPSDWEHMSNVIPFLSREDAMDYLKKLKSDYHGKGKVSDGVITGRKVTKFKGHSMDIQTVENIRTELVEANYGQELEISNESDVGECPFGEV